MDDDWYAVDSQYTFQNHYVMYDYRQVTCQQYTVKKTAPGVATDRFQNGRIEYC